jgi:hypothetical protein
MEEIIKFQLVCWLDACLQYARWRSETSLSCHTLLLLLIMSIANPSACNFHIELLPNGRPRSLILFTLTQQPNVQAVSFAE